MKRWSAFILILASSFGSFALACGFYPGGDFLRFCFLQPERFGDDSFSEFWYSANLFAPRNGSFYPKGQSTPNEQLWRDYCKGKVPVAAIEEVLNDFSAQDISAKTSNAMLLYLQRNKDQQALDYLQFAKQCEVFNALFEDPWERSEKLSSPRRAAMIAEARRREASVQNPNLQLRYAFLAIRMAYYNHDSAQIRKLYERVFALRDQKNILDYWSLYFRTYAETDATMASFFAAQVFANAPDKRFMVYAKFSTEAKLQDVLQYAQTDAERANVHLLAATRMPNRALEQLQKVRQYDPKNPGLDFLLLREMNKIEDWVFTPYYSLFHPSIDEASYFDDQAVSVPKMLQRVARDRAYAKSVLDFVNTVDATKTPHPEVWQASKAHLLFLTRQYQPALDCIAQMEAKPQRNDSIGKQLRILKALNLVANQAQGQAVIPEAVKPIILENANDKKFLFALGRELEYHGNTTQAALLYSRLNDRQGWYDEGVVWKTKNSKTASYQDYYEDYFAYADATYTVPQLQALIDDVKSSAPKDAFEQWQYGILKPELPRLYDLLGTKYIRQNQLKLALEQFNKIEEAYWSNYYTAWGGNSGRSFDANPFFTLKYTPDFMADKEHFIANKASVTKKLLAYLAKAGNPKEPQRDYYYFLVGNCYLNMTREGNAWMMRRFGYSDYDVEPFPEDESEFRNGWLGRKYYRLAYQHAKSPEFKALCLRLARDFKKLQREYPDDYEDLVSSCNGFERYFEARSKK